LRVPVGRYLDKDAAFFHGVLTFGYEVWQTIRLFLAFCCFIFLRAVVMHG
jgi:hypothetical protein